MKKIVLMIVSLVLVFGLTACDDVVCIGPECLGEVGEGGGDCTPSGSDGIVVDNALPFKHLNGHGVESDRLAFILYEYEVRDYVKYQVTYISCTCRPADYNYWQVAFVEINKYTNDIRTISFSSDSGEAHYTAGLWGDSSPTPAGITLADFENDFFPWLIGKTSADLEGIYAFTNEPYYELTNTTTIAEQDLIDQFAGSSVSTNNLIRMFQSLFIYHEETYGN